MMLSGLLPADARDEFLGHLLENGGQHAQPTLAAAGAELALHTTAEPAQNKQLSEAAQAGDPLCA